MVRTIITPQNTDIHISIPQKYVGKRVEITFLDLDEIEAKKQVQVSKEDITHLVNEKSLAQDWLSEDDNRWDKLL